jgi:hypothetical protein
MAVQAHWRRGTSLRLTLLLSQRVYEDKALAERIWLTKLTKDPDSVMNGVLGFKKDCDKAIAQSKMTLDDVVQPEVSIFSYIYLTTTLTFDQWADSVEDNSGAFTVYRGTYQWRWKVYKKC